jgi:hypothetical protein
MRIYPFQNKEKKINMKFSLSNLLKMNTEPSLVVLLGAQKPNQDVLDALSRNSDLTVREAFTTRGVLQDLPGVHLVILDELISLPDTSNEVLHRALEMSSIPMVSQEGFLADPNEWLGRARLTNAKRISFFASTPDQLGELVGRGRQNHPGDGNLQTVCAAYWTASSAA